MKITFDIPDSTKAFHGCLVYEKKVFNLQMVTWDIPTNGLEDKMLVVLPPERLDGEQE